MGCASCAASSEVAFTLTVYVEGRDRTVTVDFCSSECLKQWTCDGCARLSEWTWGVTESAEDDPAENRQSAEDRQPAEQPTTHPESDSTLARMY